MNLKSRQQVQAILHKLLINLRKGDIRMEEKPAFEVPEGIGEKMWHNIIKLLVEQGRVEITYFNKWNA